MLVRSLTAEFDPDKYTDDYRVQVLDLIGRKAAGEEFELPAVADEKPKIVDMMAALEASVEAAKAARKRHPTARETPAAGVATKAAARPKTAKPPDADRLLITADAGGSNGYRLRAWKVELARLAAETGLRITVCHYPPGTSKWNRIEHRMFSFIAINWRSCGRSAEVA